MPVQKPGRSKQDYGTPPEVLIAIKKKLGIENFVIDGAASQLNTTAKHFFSEENNGLTQPWKITSASCLHKVCEIKTSNLGVFRTEHEENQTERARFVVPRLPEDTGKEHHAPEALDRTGKSVIGEAAAPEFSSREAMEERKILNRERNTPSQKSQSSKRLVCKEVGPVQGTLERDMWVLRPSDTFGAGSLHSVEQPFLSRNGDVEHSAVLRQVQLEKGIAATTGLDQRQSQACLYCGETEDNGWIYINPPYADIAPWVKKAWSEVALGTRTAMLLPASVGSDWWRDWVHEKAHVLVMNGRVKFMGAKDLYPKDTVVLLYSKACFGGYEIWDWRK